MRCEGCGTLKDEDPSWALAKGLRDDHANASGLQGGELLVVGTWQRTPPPCPSEPISPCCPVLPSAPIFQMRKWRHRRVES